MPHICGPEPGVGPVTGPQVPRGPPPITVVPSLPWLGCLDHGLLGSRQEHRGTGRTVLPLREQPCRGLGWPHGRWGFEQVTRGQPLGSSPLSPALPGSLTHQRRNTAPWRVPECVLCAPGGVVVKDPPQGQTPVWTESSGQSVLVEARSQPVRLRGG